MDIKEGDRVRAWINDEYSSVAGKEGKVYHIDDLGTIHIRFDDGQQLTAIPGVDIVEKIPPKTYQSDSLGKVIIPKE